MKIETTFSNGDTVYGIQKEYQTDSWFVIGPLTIGQVRVKVTESPGINGEDTFDNFMAQHDREEQYMCVETGIGSGNLYNVESLFASKAEAKKAANNRNGDK